MQTIAPLWFSATFSAIVLDKAAAQQSTDTGRRRPGVSQHQDFADSEYDKGQRGTYRQKKSWFSEIFD